MEELKKDDWQKIFDSLNIVKRICVFHKEIIINQGVAKDLIKLVVKQTDNLRSQVAKNSCMTLQYIFQEIPGKDLDPVIDVALSSLLKKAIDTNHFVSEQADKALQMVCFACNESKVFHYLNSAPSKGAPYKMKICVCYSYIIQKLGSKISNFKEVSGLAKAIVANLSEGAQEVRNAAKQCFIALNAQMANSQEFE